MKTNSDTRSARNAKLARRTFVKGVALGGLAAGFGLWRPSVWALTSAGQPTALAGTEFDLSIGETPMNFTGAPRLAVTVNGSLPAPILRWREGDTVTLRVANRLDATTRRFIGTASCCRPTWTACQA